MKVAAQFAATYGVIYRLPGLTESEAMVGLMVNIPRLRAQRVLEQSAAFAMAMSGEVPDELFDTAAESPKEAGRMKVSAWASAGRARLEASAQRRR